MNKRREYRFSDDDRRIRAQGSSKANLHGSQNMADYLQLRQRASRLCKPVRILSVGPGQLGSRGA